MFVGGEIAYRALRCFQPPASWRAHFTPSSRPTPSKLADYWGEGIWADLRDRTVVDFGCRTGADAIEMARHGARHVTGIDILPEPLEVARRAAAEAHLAHLCTFTTSTNAWAERIICIDAFEHFEDPAAVLRLMDGMLTPGGSIYVSFGPPWYHPRGGHSFSVFPWAHLLFTETSLLRWRSDFRADGAQRFGEVEGGLNQMTLHRFERLIADSPFHLERFEAIPIRAAHLLHCALTRECLTSMVRCRLVRK